MTLDRDRVIAALPAYEIGGELGRGGWGVVLAGRHRQLGREVAIKQLPRAFAADPAVRARFVAEARLLASLDHPHIVPVYDYVEADGLCLLVMEKLPGGTLWSRFTSTGVTARGRLRPGAGRLRRAARRPPAGDPSPGREAGEPHVLGHGALKVTDFGIAKVVGGPETMATRAGEVLGTPAYMAPEQAQAAELGPADRRVRRRRHALRAAGRPPAVPRRGRRPGRALPARPRAAPTARASRARRARGRSPRW